jgi:hypothetical protein
LAGYRLNDNEDPQQSPAARADVVQSVTAAAEGDCFAALPEELQLMIAVHLPTADFLNARLATRAFWRVFHEQQFWASRFKTSGERSWLFEARSVRGKRDWRRMYRTVHGPPASWSGLQNRLRIWGLIQGVLDVLNLVWNDPPLAVKRA